MVQKSAGTAAKAVAASVKQRSGGSPQDAAAERRRLRPDVDHGDHLDRPVDDVAGEPLAAPALAERAYADVDHPLRHAFVPRACLKAALPTMP